MTNALPQPAGRIDHRSRPQRRRCDCRNARVGLRADPTRFRDHRDRRRLRGRSRAPCDARALARRCSDADAAASWRGCGAQPRRRARPRPIAGISRHGRRVGTGAALIANSPFFMRFPNSTWCAAMAGWSERRCPPIARSSAGPAATAPPSFPSLVRQTCAVLTSSVVARTSVIRAANGFNTSLRCGEDFDLWLRLSRHGAAMAVQPEPLVRPAGASASPSAHDDTQFRRALDVLCAIRDRLPLAHPDRDCVDVRIDELRRLLDHRLGHRPVATGLSSVALPSAVRAGVIAE